jgi:hypothetical protein
MKNNTLNNLTAQAALEMSMNSDQITLVNDVLRKVEECAMGNGTSLCLTEEDIDDEPRKVLINRGFTFDICIKSLNTIIKWD